MLLIIFIFLLLTLGSQTIFANQPLKLATLEFPPYEFKTDCKIDGITVRIVKTAFSRMNQPVNLIQLPWSRALRYLKNGKIDGLFEILKKKERETYTDFSNIVLMNESIVLFVPEDSNIVFDGNLTRLSAYTFGLQQDFSYGFKFDNAVKNNIINKTVVDVYPDNLLMCLNQGKIDILIGDKYTIPYIYQYLKQYRKSKFLQWKKIKILLPEIQVTPSFMAFSKKNRLTGIRDKFDNTLAAMKKDGTYDRLIKSWNLSN